MTSWAAAVVLGCLSAKAPDQVSLELPGVSLEGFCERLSVETGVDYSVEDRLKREMVAIRVEGMGVEELKGYVGDVVYGRWVPEGDGQKLVFDEGWVEREKRESDKRKIGYVRQAKQDIRDLLRWRSAPGEGAEGMMTQIRIEDLQHPEVRCLLTTLLAIPDRDWLRCMQARRLVFSSSPIGVQAALPTRTAIPFYQRLVEGKREKPVVQSTDSVESYVTSESSRLLDEINSYSQYRQWSFPSVNEMPDELIIELLSNEIGNLEEPYFEASLTAFDKDGQVMSQTFFAPDQYISDMYKSQGRERASDIVVRKVLQSMDELIEEIDSGGDRKLSLVSHREQLWLEKVNEKLSDPIATSRLIQAWKTGEMNEFPNIEAREYIAYSRIKQRPIVAWISGELGTGNELSTKQLLWKTEFRGWGFTEPEVKNGVVLKRVGLDDAGQTRFEHVDRLVEMFEDIGARTSFEIDWATRVYFEFYRANLSSSNPFGSELPLPEKLERLLAEVDDQFCDVWGGFTGAQQQRLRQGNPIPFVEAPDELRKQFEEEFRTTPESFEYLPEEYPRKPWEMQKNYYCGNGYVSKTLFDRRDEPTEMMPFGIPSNAYFEAEVVEELQVGEIDEVGELRRFASAEQVAYDSEEARIMGPYREQSHEIQLCQLVKVKSIRLKLVVGEDVGAYFETVEGFEPVGVPFVQGQYPRSFTSLIDRARAEMVLSPIYQATVRYWEACARELAEDEPTR